MSVDLSPLAAVTPFSDCRAALAGPARLAAAVVEACSLQEADAILEAGGIRTEFEYERDMAGDTE